MEMGSGSGANGSSDSLDGLMFGKKIYFEDVGNGANGSISSSSSSSKAIAAPPPPPKKGKALAHGGGGAQNKQQQQPPRCQVEGCLVDLTGAKAYYCRHKVCGMHSKSPKVVVAGIEQRFCQQCSRFHQLQEFDQGKRSCRRRLAGHNERRRKPPPGPSPLSPRYGRLSSSFYEDSSRYRSYLMDFSYPRTQPPVYRASDRAATGYQWPAAYPYVNPSNHYAAATEIPPSQYFAGVADSSCALSLLSTQQLWGPTAVPRSRPPNISSSGALVGAPMGPSPMAVATTCMAHPWGVGQFEEDDDDGNGNGNGNGHGQFSGELELALQGNGHGHCPIHGPVRGYDHDHAHDHCGHGMHWSL